MLFQISSCNVPFGASFSVDWFLTIPIKPNLRRHFTSFLPPSFGTLPYYTKDYLKIENARRRKRNRQLKDLADKTQVDLAGLIIKELDIPDNIRLVVVADEYFEGKKLTKLCRKKGYVFIVPVDSRRSFAAGGMLHARGKRVARSAYRELTLRRGEEDTASHRRHAPRSAGKRGRRAYRFYWEERDVATIGEVGVVYSWKTMINRSGRLTSRETFKVLVCSDPTISGEQMIEWYEMRWPVEVFFREMKSYLGFSDYQGTDFRACERHIDLVVLSFMFLEDMRRTDLARLRSPVKKRALTLMRTAGLLTRFEREANVQDLRWVTEMAKGRSGMDLVQEVVDALIPAA